MDGALGRRGGEQAGAGVAVDAPAAGRPAGDESARALGERIAPSSARGRPAGRRGRDGELKVGEHGRGGGVHLRVLRLQGVHGRERPGRRALQRRRAAGQGGGSHQPGREQGSPAQRQAANEMAARTAERALRPAAIVDRHDSPRKSPRIGGRSPNDKG